MKAGDTWDSSTSRTYTYVHACIHAYTPRILRTSLYFNGVQNCIHYFLFFLFSFLYSIFFAFCLLCSYHTFIGGWMLFKSNRGGFAYKRHAAHVWTGVDFVCCLRAWWLFSLLLYLFVSFLSFLSH
ncbi:hypothetical protein ASPBRDRAFT_255326 [Aspergillus brasiliensis CBS 101740]|uniref:Uncharacterized protein n=1 Tax=Aspergillus brasiliensis (strain CBS 101740 / IMI 381727 / IBT 21946) TaxID=767769 RepID=A0A1L9V2H2_ASPBC|nr:hypothetical protein ASPBRDRAFT_255326 [Aspergillus brasiliensis CBS 101740]